MSFDLWIDAFKDEEKFWFPTTAFLHRFDGHIIDKEERTFRLSFDGDPTLCRVSYYPRGDSVDGFSISRPTAHAELWEIIAGFLRDLPCVLYWPSTTHNSCMGSLDLLPHLPASFIEACGIPFVSTDPETIRRYVSDNG